MFFKQQLLPRECWALCAPDGPHTPFSYQTFWVDVFRIIVMILGLTIIVLTPRVVLRVKTIGMRARFLGQMCFALIAIGTEVDHLGDYSHYRLYLTFLATVLMLFGMWRLRYENLSADSPVRGE